MGGLLFMRKRINGRKNAIKFLVFEVLNFMGKLQYFYQIFDNGWENCCTYSAKCVEFKCI